MARIPLLPEDTSEPQELVQSIRSRRGGALMQVDRLLLRRPGLARGWNAWVGAIRSPVSLTYFHRELATMAVAVLNETEFEVVRHAPAFRREGGTAEQVSALLSGIESAMKDIDTFDAAERAILELAFEVTRRIKVTQPVFDRARAAVGDDDSMLELMAILITYNMTTRLVVGLELDVYGDPI